MRFGRIGVIVAVACVTFAITRCSSPSRPSAPAGVPAQPVSPTPTPVPAVTPLPKDGVSTYRLTIRAPVTCQTVPWNLVGPFTFDGTLTVQGDSWQFRFDTPTPLVAHPFGELLVNITRSGSHLTGTMSTSPVAGPLIGNYYFNMGPPAGVGPPIVLVGAIGLDGSLSASFDGTIAMPNENADFAANCSASGFTWVLTPIT